jgi:hypothetical protein
MTSGPLDLPNPQLDRPGQRLTLVPPLREPSQPAIHPHPQAPPAREGRDVRAAYGVLSLAGTVSDRLARLGRLASQLAGRLPRAGERHGHGSQPRNRARGVDADPRSVCLLGGPFPLVGSPRI